MGSKTVLILFCLLFLLSSNVFATDAEPFTYQILDWSKGLGSYINPYLLPKNQGTVFQNLRVGKEYGGLTKRDALLLYGDTGSSQINGLHRYYQSDETKQLLVNYSTLLAVGDDSAGTFTTIQAGLTENKIWQWLTYKNKAIGVNGTDQSIKYDGATTTTADTDGARTATYLCAELGAPFCELDTGTDLDNDSWYAYQIAHFNSTTAIYRYSTAISNTILTGSAVYNLALTDIPIGPSGTTERIIYRTEGYSSRANLLVALAAESLYKVAEISDNTTQTYADSVDDDTLDDDATPTWSTVSAGTDVTPPIGKYAIINDQRLFIAENSTDKSSVYWSEQYYPDIFDKASDNRQIRPDDGDNITGLSIVLGQLVVFKNNSLQKFFTEGADADNDWSISDPYTNIGCVSPCSIANTPKGVVYLYWDGLYLFDGTHSTLISEVVQDVIQDISKPNIENCYGYYNDNKYYLAYTSNESGETENNRVLIYDMLKDSYVIDLANINVFTSFNSGTDTNVLYSGDSSTGGKVWAYSAGADVLTIKTKSDFNLGTFDDAKVYNTETSPKVDIAWGLTIDEWGSISATIDGFSGGGYLVDREDTDGTWTSPIYQLNASSLNKLYWNEELNNVGDITFQIRTGATTGAVSAASWSSAFTDSSGSDISGETANVYLQIRANLSTTNQEISPELVTKDGFTIKLNYLKSGTTDETAISSKWVSGWSDLDAQSYKKELIRIKIFYRGTAGTLTFGYKNGQGNVDNSFDIDLSTVPDSSSFNAYTGSGDYKVYTYRPLATEVAKGQYFQFTISDSGITEWTVDRVEILAKRVELYD